MSSITTSSSSTQRVDAFTLGGDFNTAVFNRNYKNALVIAQLWEEVASDQDRARMAAPLDVLCYTFSLQFQNQGSSATTQQKIEALQKLLKTDD